MIDTPFALERYFAHHEFRARHLLSSSDCETRSLAELLALADEECERLWRDLRLGYSESRGLPELRAEIAKGHEGLHADDVLCCVPEEAIFLTEHALLRPGDRVVVTSPGYQSLHEVASSIGCEVRHWRPDEAAGWRFDPDVLEALLGDGAKLVVLNFPHNPTGYVPTDDEWARILELVSGAGAWLFSDEMYRGLGHAPASDRTAVSVRGYPRAISLGGLSKAHGLPGLRQGWLATRDRALLDRVAELKDYTTICGTGPGELLGLIALRAGKTLIAQGLARIDANLRVFDDFLAENPGLFAWQRPRAGSMGLARLVGAESAAAFCERAVEQAGVMLVPSTLFDYGDAHVRIGLGRASFPESLEALARWIRGARAR